MVQNVSQVHRAIDLVTLARALDGQEVRLCILPHSERVESVHVQVSPLKLVQVDTTLAERHVPRCNDAKGERVDGFATRVLVPAATALLLRNRARQDGPEERDLLVIVQRDLAALVRLRRHRPDLRTWAEGRRERPAAGIERAAAERRGTWECGRTSVPTARLSSAAR